MTPEKLEFAPDYWRRAAETRRLAELIDDNFNRRHLVGHCRSIRRACRARLYC
jgi:hypothetical protein